MNIPRKQSFPTRSMTEVTIINSYLGEWLGAWMLVLNGNDYQGLIIFSLLFKVCANDPNVSQNDRQ